MKVQLERERKRSEVVRAGFSRVRVLERRRLIVSKMMKSSRGIRKTVITDMRVENVA